MSGVGDLARIIVSDPGRVGRSARARVSRTVDDSALVNRFRRQRGTRLETFSAAYATAAWGSAESGSGTGSELRATEVIRGELAEMLRRHGITSLLDAPCGDWNWMQHVDLSGVTYTGADIVPAVIESNRAQYARPGVEFVTADLTEDQLPTADAVLCRDCLVHVSYADIAAMIANFRRTGATWLLVSNHPEVRRNRDQATSLRWRRLNLRSAPFHFPEPVDAIPDGGDVDPTMLTLWRLSDLPDLDALSARTSTRA